VENQYQGMANQEDIPDNLEELDKKQLQNLVRDLQFKIHGEEHLTKNQIINRLTQIEELDLDKEEDLMNTEDQYNLGLKKSGWMKLYKFIKQAVENR
jgi:hypothetical protein